MLSEMFLIDYKIYDVDLGTRAPSINRIGVSRVRLDAEKQQIEAVDFNLNVDYSGGLGIAIDLALAYNKSAFLSAKGAPIYGKCLPIRSHTTLLDYPPCWLFCHGELYTYLYTLCTFSCTNAHTHTCTDIDNSIHIFVILSLY